MRLFLFPVAIVAALVVPSAASATHSWGSYHWARTNNPFTLKLGDNVSATWDPYLTTTSGDWSASSNQHPNAHDYAQLESIYAHLDSTTTLNSVTGPSAGANFKTLGELGRRVSGSEAPHSVAVYERDLGANQRLITLVIWAG